MYKQVPKGTSKMEILSRNLISISIAQKVPACISKQLPPFNNEISNKPFQHLLPVQKKTMMAKYHQTFPSSVAQPQQSRAEQCSGASMCWAAQPTLGSPWCCQAGRTGATGQASPCLRVSKPAATWSDRQDWEAGRGEGGDEGGHAIPVFIMADKQILHKHKGKKEIRTYRTTVDSLRRRKWTKTR